MHVLSLRAIFIVVALGESVWAGLFYFVPGLALGALGRSLVDPVIARQLPLYLASCALAYCLAAVDPIRYARILWISVIARLVDIAVAGVDWRTGELSTTAFIWIIAIEGAVVAVSCVVLRAVARTEKPSTRDPGDRGLTIALRCFGGLELFWFVASTIFVQIGARLLQWKLQDPYTTQQQGIALLVIGLVSLLAASDVARYRVFVWVPIFSQLVGVANSFNEIRLGSITWSIAAVQWTIELSIVFCFAWFSRAYLKRNVAVVSEFTN
jgi:hypothetical protein